MSLTSVEKGPAMALHHDVQSGAMNLKDKLLIELAPDSRHGKVTYGGQILNAKVGLIGQFNVC
jgi:transcription initiation factor TFIID subunit 7